MTPEGGLHNEKPKLRELDNLKRYMNLFRHREEVCYLFPNPVEAYLAL